MPPQLESVSCNLCGRDDYKVLFDSPPGAQAEEDLADFVATTDRFARYGRIVRCRGCRLVYTNPRPSAQSILQGYEKSEDADYAAEDASRSINAHLSLHIIKQFAPKGDLLDVGCATGYFLNAARLDYKVSGVEPSRWAAQHAREKLGLEVREGPLDRLDLPDGSIDVATMLDVIEHLTDPLSALRSIHRVLKPQGLLYLVTPDIESLSAKILRGRWWGLRPAHLYYYSSDTLKAALEKAGFETLLVRSYGRMFTYGYWLSRLRNYPFWMRKSAELAMRLFGREDKFLYLDTRDSVQVCARKK